jgi:hypothetical protein
MLKCSISNLNEVEGKEKFRVDVANRFAALKDLDVTVDSESALSCRSPLLYLVIRVAESALWEFQCHFFP